MINNGVTKISLFKTNLNIKSTNNDLKNSIKYLSILLVKKNA